ncbi:hypothetical protein [Tissierella praeacuta]|uniref:hypothetical protein n=1 Tax=Tissierella praeacuta TaxID=43131 RepID=UPI00289F8F54|nr:hypothetical protein [Tissierella praeacuta]
MIDEVIKRAARIMKENPSMKFYEALIEAKKLLKEKDLQDGNPKRSKIKISN